MVRDGGAGAIGPELGDLGAGFSFIGNAGAEHVIECRNPVAGDNQQRIAELVDVADLALTVRTSVGQRGLENRRGERHAILRRKGGSYKVTHAADNNNM